MRRVNLASLAAGLWCAVASQAAWAQQAPCRHALALALDVSGSVDAQEYRLQIEGIAHALGTSAVRNALLGSPSASVELLVFEWSGTDDQHVLLDWMPIRSPADISVVQETLRQTQRRATSPGTALGTAMNAALQHLERRAACSKRTLDISGDGKSNLGPEPRDQKSAFGARGITVNALVVGADSRGTGSLRQVEIGELLSYYSENVIVGSDAFVQTSLGYSEYADAMARKLERELGAVEVSLGQ